ncbi:MAG: type III-B CRISPR module RAMP protein Cmr6 [Chloroflexota bacterium]|jgi:CRISPR-associated protein Cmr6
MDLKYPIPHASAEAFKSFLTKTIPANAGLVFDRFAPDTQEEEKGGGREDPPKKKGLVQVRDLANKRADKELLQKWNIRWRETVKKDHAEPFPKSTDWRFITGLGRKGPFEVGFTFNRYGFPYLPGSSVKGIARAQAFYDIAEAVTEEKLKILFEKVYENVSEKERKEKNLTPFSALDDALLMEKQEEFESAFHACNPSKDAREKADKFRKIFGNTGRAGGAVFFDAIPDDKTLPVLELDIINPHYPDYYEDQDGKKGKYPTDWQSPVPTYFLTVAPNTKFWFAVGWRGEPNSGLQTDAIQWLKAGLENLGAGAKTSAGYGYFKHNH